jgi:hypothetical protein
MPRGSARQRAGRSTALPASSWADSEASASTPGGGCGRLIRAPGGRSRAAGPPTCGRTGTAARGGAPATGRVPVLAGAGGGISSVTCAAPPGGPSVATRREGRADPVSPRRLAVHRDQCQALGGGASFAGCHHADQLEAVVGHRLGLVHFLGLGFHAEHAAEVGRGHGAGLRQRAVDRRRRRTHDHLETPEDRAGRHRRPHRECQPLCHHRPIMMRSTQRTAAP